MQPLISVVTVCLNSQSSIRETIESVLKQNIEDLEYLIVDGASTDKTVDIAREYLIPFKGRLTIVSEKDNGWYDAMNKGILLSKGKFINFLNSDDHFDIDVIDKVSDFIRRRQIDENCIVYGDSTNVYRDRHGKTYEKRIKAPEHVAISDKNLLTGMCGIRHQSMFTGRKVFERIGLLDLRYRLHADWDFLIKCLRENIRLEYLNDNMTFYSMYGLSTNPRAEERHLIRKNHHLYRFFDFYYFMDRFGPKVLAKNILGTNTWNDLLFWYHTTIGGKREEL